MKEYLVTNFDNFAGVGLLVVIFAFLLMIWSVVWKGFALWFAAKDDSKPWFIVLMIINTFGILEIVYIFFVSKKGKECIVQWKQKRFKPKGNMGLENEAPKVSEEN